MKYTKTNVVAIAQARGSKSTSIAGAVMYLRTHIPRPRTRLEHSGVRQPWARGADAVQEYRESELHARAQAFCEELGLKTREEYRQIARKREQTILSRVTGYISDHYPYRMSQSSWAGGEHYVNVRFGEIGCSGGSNQVWSDNGKWSGTDSYAEFTISRRVLRYFPDATTPDGLVVLDAKRITLREYEIVWAEQARGFDLKPVKGFLIRGYHVPGIDLTKARKKAAIARAKTLDTRIKERARKQAHKCEIAALTGIWVGFDDSIRVGNCETATRQYQHKLSQLAGGIIGGIRADYLLALRDDVYTRRAVAKAEERYA